MDYVQGWYEGDVERDAAAYIRSLAKRRILAIRTRERRVFAT